MYLVWLKRRAGAAMLAHLYGRLAEAGRFSRVWQSVTRVTAAAQNDL